MKAARKPLFCLALLGGLVACGGKVIFDTGGAGASMGSGGAHTTTVGSAMTTVNGTTVNGTTVGKGATGNVTISSSVYAVSAATGVTTGSGCMPAPVVVAGESAEVACFNWSNSPCPTIDNPALAGALTTLIDTGKSGCDAKKVVNVACTDHSMSSGCCYLVITASPCTTGG